LYLETSALAQVRQLRSHPRIVEAGAHRVRFGDLTGFGLENVGCGAVEHARLSGSEGGPVLAAREAQPAGLDGYEANVRVIEERGEDAHCVRAAADAGDHRIRQPADSVADLLARFLADHRLQISHESGVGVRPGYAADRVER